jgi:hypothetical protein
MTKNRRTTRSTSPGPRTNSINSRRARATIGGQSAEVIYDLIERTTRVMLVEGVPLVTIDPEDLCEEHAAMWQSAYDDIERELMAEMEACANQHEHRDMSELEWMALVTHSVAAALVRCLASTTCTRSGADVRAESDAEIGGQFRAGSADSSF